MRQHRSSKCVRTLAVSILMMGMAFGETAAAGLKGRVTDPSGASIPGAAVTLEGPATLKQQTALDGRYEFRNLPEGKYTVRISAPGFTLVEMLDYEIAGAATLDVPMTVAVEAQKIDVTDERNKVDVDPNANAAAIVLRGADLESLSDDPDQLESDLQALAGPSAGPNGGQIYIDGFTGGRLPPKSSIREVRINQNPFSAEFDRLGYGRIEILTKPGTDKFRGQFMTMVSDNTFNARNPYVSSRPPYQSRMFDGSFSGPLSKKASFNFDVEHRGIDDQSALTARLLDASGNPYTLTESLATPQSRWNIVPRIDYQLNAKNTLTGRYAWSTVTSDNQGIGGFNLATRAYNTHDTEHTAQLTETAVLSGSAISETRLQFMRTNVAQDGGLFAPVVSVADAFTSGGASSSISGVMNNRWEVQNTTSINHGRHSTKFGGRVRTSNYESDSNSGFQGTFSFQGGVVAPVLDASNNVLLDANGNPLTATIDSLEQYRRTVALAAAGFTAAQIRALGGGASLFTITGGNPRSSISQTDLGVFVLDDWRVRPNLTFSYGLRYETQTNIHDWTDFAPRIGLAWGIGGGAKKQAKTVLRAGLGVFYDRVDSTLTLDTLRLNGINQQQYIVSNPDFYPVVPSLATLAAAQQPQTIRQLADSLRAPYLLQGAVSVDRQLPRSTSLSLTYMTSRGVHTLRSVDLGTVNGSNVYQYEATGLTRQHQFIVNMNTRFSKRVTLFGNYSLGYARGNTDSASTFPATPDYRSEWGPTSFDIRHRVFLGGAIQAPGRLTLNPFIVASSGSPFNITAGKDLNGDGILNDRPAFATAATVNPIVTQWGTFDANPLPGETIIPRNYGRGPAQFNVNMRLSRTWGIGKKVESAASSDFARPGPMGGPGGPGGRGGFGRMMGGGSSGRRISLTLGVMAHNLLNFVNQGSPVSTLSSPLFGQTLTLASGFGPMRGSAANNRRLDFQLRISF